MVAHRDPSLSEDDESQEPTLRDGLGDAPAVDAVDRAAVLGAVQRSLLGEPSVPVRIGRYVVLRPLGSGGMGMVYAAFDEDLDRKVAIKLLRDDPGESDVSSGADDRTRLRAEARALARLSHPNVVTVHEVGEHEERLYLAMEYIRGQTLRQWVGEGRRPWRGIVDAMVAAGRGLVAVHRAGLVHRDFKPANVMVSDDGAVKVMDFGLALQRREEGIRIDPEDPAVASTRVDTPLTRTGTLLGTPAYMSPEQFAGSSVGSASDQYSFCVSLFELLYGERPFQGATVAELAGVILNDPPRSPPPGTDVPASVHRVILRGLQADASARFPDMEALLEELQPAPRGRSVWPWLGGVGLVCGGLIAVNGRDAPESEPCADAPAALEEVWTQGRARELSDTLRAADAFVDVERVRAALDGYAVAWTLARTDACEATHVRREQSAERLDLRMACLDRRLASFDALATQLETGTSEVAGRANMAAAQLPPLSRCGDVDYLEAEVRPPEDPAVAARVSAVMMEVANLDALVATGQYEAALASVEDLAVRAEAFDYPPLVARLLYSKGAIQQELGRPEDSKEALRAAYFGAVEARDRTRAVMASSRLVFVCGVRMQDIDCATRWWEHARAWTGDLEQSDPLRALPHSAYGNALSLAGRYPKAQAELDAAIGILDGPEPARPLWLSDALHNRGDVLLRLNQHEGARADLERAAQLRIGLLGPAHPFVASTLTLQGNLALRSGDLERATDLYQRAADLYERSLGANNPSRAGVLANLGVVLKRQGRYEEARTSIEAARSAFAKTFGEQHPAVAQAIDLLGTVAFEEERYDDAKAAFEEAIRMAEPKLGADHPKVLSSTQNLGEALLAQGRPAEAEPLFERAAQGRRDKLGPEHPWVAQSLGSLGDARQQRGDTEGARAAFEQAAKVCSASDCDEGEALAARLAALDRTAP